MDEQINLTSEEDIIEEKVEEVYPSTNEEETVTSESYKYDAYSKPFQGTYFEEKKKEKKHVSVAAFVITMIFCMLFSMAGGGLISYYLLSGSGTTQVKVITTTNYDIVKSTGSVLSIQEIAAKNENSVVAITTEAITTDSWFGSYITGGAGSGVIYSEDGYIITNNHVIDGATKITVTLANGTDYEATLVATDAQTDVAVIKINETKLIPVTIGDSANLCVGELAVAIGNPLGTLAGTVSQGIISALERNISVEGKKMTLIQTTAAINPGNSGGGLFDSNGNLIGLVVAKSAGSDIEGLGFAIPVNKVVSVAQSLIEKGYVSGRPQLGVTILDLSSVTNAWKYGVSYPGIYIQTVTGENAEKAGLKPGDMIYKLNGELVTSSTQFVQEIQSMNVGDTVTLTIVRDSELDKMLTIEVVLEESTNN